VGGPAAAAAAVAVESSECMQAVAERWVGGPAAAAVAVESSECMQAVAERWVVQQQ